MANPRFYPGQGDYILQLNLMDQSYTAALAAIGSIPELTADAEAAAQAAIDARDAATGAATDAGQAKTGAETAAGLAQQYRDTAQQHRDNALGARDLAIKWATYTGGEVVAGQGFSALQYALNAKAQADRAQGYADTMATGQIQANWTQTDVNAKDFIKNKPKTLAEYGITGGTFSNSVTVANQGPAYFWTETDQINADGMFRMVGQDNALRIEKNTSTARDWATWNTPWMINSQGAVQMDQPVPTGTPISNSTLWPIGIYMTDAGSNTANSPEALTGILNFSTNSGNRGGQLVLGESSVWFRRHHSSKTASFPWVKLWSELNDGAGSGLDADLLDGANSDVNATNSTIVKRDATGGILVTNLDLSHATASRTTDTVFYSSNGSALFKNTATGFKTSLGLQNVDNTSDAAKPVSTAQQTALNTKAPLAAPLLTGDARIDDHSINVKYSDNGASSAFNLKNGRMQKWSPASGTSPTISISNWKPSGLLSLLLVEGKNLGLVTTFFPTGTKFIKSDRTEVTSFSQMGVTFQTNGTDRFLLFSYDGGTTVYMKMT